MKFYLLALSLILCTSCSAKYLTVYTDYLSHENLASSHIGSPDPQLNHPPVGQRLILSWSVPKRYRNLHLEITLRFRTREEYSMSIPLKNVSGDYIYSLINEDYFQKRGILTYKVDLFSENSLLEEWKHQLWTELIQEPTEN